MNRSSTQRVSWEEWKERCAIGLCGSEASADLCTYGGRAIAGLWRKFGGKLSEPFESNQQRWHLFESYMHACSARTGKRWKDWLFEKADGSSDPFVVVLEKEAYECMDSTVRKYCVGESHRKAHQAGVWLNHWDEPVSNSEQSAMTYGEVFAGNPWEEPAQLAAWNELRAIAQAEAEELFRTLDQAGKTVLLAKRLEISLGEPAVERMAGKKKTALYGLQKEIGERNRSHLLEKYSSEDARTLEALVALAEEALAEAGFRWGRAENSANPIFTL
jgi:hypothetical protein